MFTVDDGTKLPRLSPEEWKRVTDTCYYHNHAPNGCHLPAKECWEKHNKKHEILPTKLKPIFESLVDGREESRLEETRVPILKQRRCQVSRS